jgi:hypothetical protein
VIEIPKRQRMHGVDFSGAVEAGRSIWIASGQVTDGVLRIEECRRGDTLPDSGVERSTCLKALRTFVSGERAAVFGFDFPFGLPRAVADGPRWDDVAHRFIAGHPNPEAFRAACLRAAQGKEWRRVTDLESRTPFSPYNLRVFRQTYVGVVELLLPLVRDGAASILPMQAPRTDGAWILEICPASTLKRLGLYSPYKGRDAERRAMRRRILESLERSGSIWILDERLWRVAIEDPGGDALDSILAAFGAFRAMTHPGGLVPEGDAYAVEGYVYDD